MYRLGNYLKEGGFFSVPCLLAESERYASMTASSRLVAHLLWCVAHRVSSPRFYAKETTLHREFRRDPKTVRKALAELEKARLLRKVPGNRGVGLSELWLCHPVSGEPFPEEDGRATPTFHGFSKAKRAATGTPARQAPCRECERQERPKGRRITIDSADPERVVSSATGPSEEIQSQPNSAQAERHCHIRKHNLVHYRPDGSSVCGDCHPTGITQPPRQNAPPEKGASRTFTPPTAKELGFSG